MGNQVITVTPDGDICGLQRKAGQGLDLRQFGKAHIERASEIAWDGDEQMWYVRAFSRSVHEAFARALDDEDFVSEYGDTVTCCLLRAIYRNEWMDREQFSPDKPNEASGLPCMWRDYEKAVQMEVAVLDRLRLLGYLT